MPRPGRHAGVAFDHARFDPPRFAVTPPADDLVGKPRVHDVDRCGDDENFVGQLRRFLMAGVALTAFVVEVDLDALAPELVGQRQAGVDEDAQQGIIPKLGDALRFLVFVAQVPPPVDPRRVQSRQAEAARVRVGLVLMAPAL